MKLDLNKSLARRFYDVWNRGSLDELDDFIAEGYIQHAPGVPTGREGLKSYMKMFRSAFPDAHLHIEAIIAENDRVAGRWFVHGTHTGELSGISPTGRSINIDGIDIWRVENGMLVEHWDAWSQLELMQQLGAFPVLE